MEWSDLKIFLAVARAGSLAGAARLVGQTQPTMGRRLKALEDSVGRSLFQRTSDGFVLTADGAAVLAHAERMDEEATAFERKLAGRDGGLEGLVRVSSSDWFGVYVLAPAFAPFIARHPRVTVELLTDARLLSLSRREADLVFRIRPFEDADVVQRKFMHLDYAAYVGAQFPEPDPRAADVAVITMDAAFEHLPDVQWLRTVLPGARTAFASNNREAQARMCAAGQGVAVLPRALGDVFPGLRRIDLGPPPPGRDVWVGYHRDLRGLPRLKALLEATIEGLQAPRA
jgi:DNA-binding transcriptional LysR family regulator